jgi:hypothetical protein
VQFYLYKNCSSKQSSSVQLELNLTSSATPNSARTAVNNYNLTGGVFTSEPCTRCCVSISAFAKDLASMQCCTKRKNMASLHGFAAAAAAAAAAANDASTCRLFVLVTWVKQGW